MSVPILLGLVWVGFAIAVAVAAHNRRRSAVLYFVASLMFSPILAIILLAISGGLKATQQPPKPINPVWSMLARGRQAIKNIALADRAQPIPRATVTAPPPWEKKP